MTKREWLALTLIMAWLCGVALNAAVPTTFVTGSLNLPSGSNPSNVTIKLTPSQSFSVTDSGGLKYQVLAPTTYSVTNSGVLAMYVVPNTGAGNYPDWTTYTAEIMQSGRVVATQTWQLASSSLPVTVANIITNSTVTTTPTNALPLAGGTMLGPIILGSNSSQSGLVWPPSTAPGTAPEGATYINSVDGKLYIRFGGVWIAPTGITTVTANSPLTGLGTGASPLGVPFDAAQTLTATRKITTTVPRDLGTAASAGTGVDTSAADHTHKGVVWQEEGANLDTGNGNKTVNIVGDGSTASATGGTATVTILASPADGLYRNLVIRRTSVTALTVTADALVLRNTSTQKSRTFRNVSETITITTAGASGLEASDAEASNTWYEIRVIAKDTDGTIDGLLNAAGGSITTMPSGYDLQTYVLGYIRNDASSNLKFIHQFNNEVMVERTANIISTGLSSTTNADVNAAAFAPPGARLASLEIGIRAASSDNDAGATLVDKDAGVDMYSPYIRDNAAAGTSLYSIVFGKVPLNSSQVFQYRVQTNSNVDLVLVGWNY